MTPLVGLLRGRDVLEQVILLMFHYAITFFIISLISDAISAGNTLKDVINEKCHKCHKCYKSNKCYKILIKYNLSFHN